MEKAAAAELKNLDTRRLQNESALAQDKQQILAKALDDLVAEKLIAADFHFTSPLDNRIDAFKFINLVPDRDRVFVTYEGHTKNGERFRNTEIVTVRNGQIVEVEVYFGWSIPHEAKPGGFVDDK